MRQANDFLTTLNKAGLYIAFVDRRAAKTTNLARFWEMMPPRSAEIDLPESRNNGTLSCAARQPKREISLMSETVRCLGGRMKDAAGIKASEIRQKSVPNEASIRHSPAYGLGRRWWSGHVARISDGWSDFTHRPLRGLGPFGYEVLTKGAVGTSSRDPVLGAFRICLSLLVGPAIPACIRLFLVMRPC